MRLRGRKNKNIARPKKRGAAKRRRILEHKRRLVDLGVSEEKVTQLTPRQMLDLLKCPKKTAAEYAS
ncbi:MAG: hypothetical protein NE334_14495 [Lentisphaeraceae bacterium]|nr:hypothetical protein [Lentisphaeraceae bacterium]